MKSVIQVEKRCYLCGALEPLHDHHIFGGTSNRSKSEKLGLKVWLCEKHHRKVHQNGKAMKFLKRKGQKYYEKNIGTREDFIKEFGRSYL